ncbi:cupin domain-containing protein [Kibdelosporangium persicum]|uniref:Cyclic nucleotide-binding domain-containing protein n=1 Tax=Kibdelosporangium persicum TaxID=2698649 RepID=A0ABX2FDG0_9PSEU|nr:cupin domain-containing protein [Kibdelosporangium persicum]NRN69394.1 Cyclic nucleotide-binding domain-containing protein [Kibdelosporangium persicum]
MTRQATQEFHRCNIFRLPLRPEVAHGGTGVIEAVRIATGETVDGGCDFIDYAVVPAGTSIGDHRHRLDEEEFYLVLSGIGTMRLEDRTFPVTAGDLVRNPPGGLHGLVNAGPDPVRLFIFQLAAGQENSTCGTRGTSR